MSFSALSLTDRYVGLLCICLLGYATFARGFAYVGFPPLFIGEICLLLGGLCFLRSGAIIASLSTIPTLILAGFMGLVAVRATGQFGEYGIDALRDSVTIIYGAFAFIVIGLILEKPQRIDQAIHGFRLLAMVAIPVAPFFYVLTRSGGFGIVPTWPNGIQLIDLRPGEMAVHLAGAAVLTLLGFRRATPLWILFFLAGVAMVTAQSRGGALAIGVPVLIAVIVSGRIQQLTKFLAAAAVVFALAYAVDLEFKVPGAVESGARPISIRQMTDNVISLFDRTGAADLEANKKFRLNWWQSIINYTVYGQYFWTGKGFGMNLAETDGFVVGREYGGPLLRSPHNGHMTILARTGVPGLGLWLAFLSAWFLSMAATIVKAKWRGDDAWANLLLFVSCYAIAIIIDATFDVALEGPMIGIWFWCLIGFGLSSSMVYRAQCARPK
jgi:hypothetical protein